MAGIEKFHGKEEEIKKILEILRNHKGSPQGFIEQLKLDPPLMRTFIDLMENYSSSNISVAKSSSAGQA